MTDADENRCVADCVKRYYLYAFYFTSSEATLSISVNGDRSLYSHYGNDTLINRFVSSQSFDICSIKKALVAPFNITTVKILCKIYEIKSTSLNLTTSPSLPSSHRRLAKKRLKQSSMVASISSDFSLGISQMHISAAISSTACKAVSITLLAAVKKEDQ
uniref:Uncharacterized protein n=1 Tax=Glossina austeni TaxID=7395 RepID=A0A1A9VRU2_GLOAU